MFRYAFLKSQSLSCTVGLLKKIEKTFIFAELGLSWKICPKFLSFQALSHILQTFLFTVLLFDVFRLIWKAEKTKELAGRLVSRSNAISMYCSKKTVLNRVVCDQWNSQLKCARRHLGASSMLFSPQMSFGFHIADRKMPFYLFLVFRDESFLRQPVSKLSDRKINNHLPLVMFFHLQFFLRRG